MSNPTNVVRVETWNVKDPANAFGDGRKVVNKVAVRVQKGKPGGGQFHGATNFKGTFLV
jgi:hypothetical protein